MASEKRLVDANKLPDGKFVDPRTEYHQGWNDALDAAASQAPTVDAVEVVRCKDCKKREICRTTNIWAVAPSDDWYCADGGADHGI